MDQKYLDDVMHFQNFGCFWLGRKHGINSQIRAICHLGSCWAQGRCTCWSQCVQIWCQFVFIFIGEKFKIVKEPLAWGHGWVPFPLKSSVVMGPLFIVYLLIGCAVRTIFGPKLPHTKPHVKSMFLPSVAQTDCMVQFLTQNYVGRGTDSSDAFAHKSNSAPAENIQNFAVHHQNSS